MKQYERKLFIAWTQDNGIVSILNHTDGLVFAFMDSGLTEREALEHLARRHRGIGDDWQVIEQSAIPSDRSKRNDWVLVPGAIHDGTLN